MAKQPIFGSVIAFLLAFGSDAHAQAPSAAATEKLQREALTGLLGTIGVSSLPSFTGGRLTGCLLEFFVLTRDFTYKKGGFVRVGGSFGLASAGQNLGATLKVIVHDIDTRTMDYTPDPPASAVLVGSDLSTNAADWVAGGKSDTPGALFAVFKAERSFAMITDGLARDRVDIAFSRRKGGQDVLVSVDPRVETVKDGQRIYSQRATLEFSDCSRKLIRSVLP